MKIEIKVSVIIPVYNVAKYLAKCLDSVIGQSLKEIEIICINDGSTDNSLKILEEYKKNDERITIINQKNQGVSVARNNGLKNAKGEYIYMLDSDDFLDVNALKRMYERAYLDNADMVLIDFYKYINNKNKEKVRYYLTFNDGANALPYTAWSYMFRKKLLTDHPDIMFPANAHPIEDTAFSFALSCVAKRFTYIYEPLLYYRQHSEMVMAKIKGEKKEQFVESNIICLKYIKEFWKNNKKIRKRNKQKYLTLQIGLIDQVKVDTGVSLDKYLPKNRIFWIS